ncbi:MAG: hypothetical protein MAGBODY4_01366 [Candidatus Marinimicrobia bacterium]|nr:hypothetical protein [Candidatus Neomarinimicrobiota bacterium]
MEKSARRAGWSDIYMMWITVLLPDPLKIWREHFWSLRRNDLELLMQKMNCV